MVVCSYRRVIQALEGWMFLVLLITFIVENVTVIGKNLFLRVNLVCLSSKWRVIYSSRKSKHFHLSICIKVSSRRNNNNTGHNS